MMQHLFQSRRIGRTLFGISARWAVALWAIFGTLIAPAAQSAPPVGPSAPPAAATPKPTKTPAPTRTPKPTATPAPKPTATPKFNYDRYKPATFAQIIKDNTKWIVEEGFGATLLPEPPPFRVKATYTGKSRKLSQADLIELWATAYKVKPDYWKRFKQEWLFVEGKTEYWLPVQDSVAAYFAKELRKGDAVELYISWVGAYLDESGNLDWIFLVNEFKAASPSKGG